MGIPLQQPCAGCGRVGSSAEGGVVFTAAECFTKPLNDAPQLWACSVQCKREALYAVLRDLPYRTSKREQQMALALQMARERSEQAAHRGSA